MSRRGRHRGRIGGLKASIDMNSLIDLTFLLLVTFMLTIPALEQGISIMLPRAKTDVLPSKNAKANTITVDEGNGNPLQYSCLENPMDGGAWWATVCGVAKSQTRMSELLLL